MGDVPAKEYMDSSSTPAEEERMTSWTHLAFSCATILALGGCTSFDQVYHFQSRSATPDGMPNYFRVKVSGDAQTARARYVAGFYDERAVDLYFNETKSTNGELRTLFTEDRRAPGETAAIKPLSPEKGQGTFVMIFSTNPKAVADTIGAFAESQVVADAITNVVNKREVETARLLTASQATNDQAATAIATELGTLIPTVPGAGAPASATLKRGYLRALEAIARQTGGPNSFADFDAARAWLGRSQ